MKPAKPNARNLALALATLAALAFAACGSSESSPTGNTNEVHGASRASGGYIVPTSDPISTGNAVSVARYPMGQENDEVSKTGAAPENPCRLVSRSEATGILGEIVRVTVGQQGPTCIYAAEGSKRQVTLAVERLDLAGLRHQARNAPRIRVGSKSGWCLHYDSTSVAVPLTDGRVLDVTGSCAVAAHFAARALNSVSTSG